MTGLSLALLMAGPGGAGAQAPPPVNSFPAMPRTLPAVPNPHATPRLVPADAQAPQVTPQPTPPSPHRPAQNDVLIYQKTADSEVVAPPMPGSSGLPVLAVPSAPVFPREEGRPLSKSPSPDQIPIQPMPRGNSDERPPSAFIEKLPDEPCLPDRKPFDLQSEQALLTRIKKELIEEERIRKSKSPDMKWQPTEAYFRIPPAAKLAGCDGPYVAKTVNYPAQTMYIEPGYVVHRRLHFEELNSERHGWELGIAQPAISTLHFYKDVILWPASLASNLRERYDTSAGKCLPGSPFPYSIYPPGYSLFGLSAEASMLVGVAFVFP